MKVNIEILVTIVIVAFILYGAYLIESGHEIIGACLLGAAALFILILIGRVVQEDRRLNDDINDLD
jgi:hypothetical protein